MLRNSSDGLVFSWGALATRLPAVSAQGVLARKEPGDFRVTEEPAYPPSGSGDHVMVQVEKTAISTLEVARRLANAVGARPNDVGFAGRKDVHAVAVQWFTVPRTKTRLPDEVGPGIRVLRTSLHKNKLQLGHLRGNTFEILLRDPASGALETLRSRLSDVAAGVPNYFGPQRFGVGGNNALDGVRVLTGERRSKDFRGAQLLVSALQSHIFNLVASERVRYDRDVLPWEGDILVKVPSGAPFWCDAPEVDAPRVQRGEVAVTGPLPGARMRRPRGKALTLESRILEEVLQPPTLLTEGKRAPVGDRRTILVRPRDLAVEAVENGIRVKMSLAPGSFATSVLREWAGILKDGQGLGGSDEA
ncbi:MAG: tRNA pseudouridine(13) synthase TruD [Myxococcota bacterium]